MMYNYSLNSRIAPKLLLELSLQNKILIEGAIFFSSLCSPRILPLFVLVTGNHKIIDRNKGCMPRE